MNSYDVGTVVRCQGTFKDSSLAPVDPTAVFAEVKPPAGEIITYEYGVDPQLVKASTGVYRFDVDADVAGVWNYRLYSTGTGKGASQGKFHVKFSRVD